MSPCMAEESAHELHSVPEVVPVSRFQDSNGEVRLTNDDLSRRRIVKPLSTGWKSLAWTKPAKEYLGGAGAARPGTRVVALEQQRLQAGHGLSSPSATNMVSPAERSAVSLTGTAKPGTVANEMRNTAPIDQPTCAPRRSSYGGYPTGTPGAAGFSPSNPPSVSPNRQLHKTPTASLNLQTYCTVPTHPVETRDGLDSKHVSEPCHSYHHDGDARSERALSDTSVMTTSDFGGPPSCNVPKVLAEVSEQKAIATLESLCSEDKGLPVVKHAGSGGGKSRKILRYNRRQGMLVFGGARPPFFKTRISVTDVDRVDVKWCCIVMHVKGRHSVLKTCRHCHEALTKLRLEVDSSSTATALRAGLMAASRVGPHEPEPEPSLESQNSSHNRQRSESSDLGLASVRPGHMASKIYDPVAALSVAARLAKELEEEREIVSGGHSAAFASTTGTPARRHRPIAPASGHASVLKRSLSMSSVGSSKATTSTTENFASATRRGFYGVTPRQREEKMIDTEAALRRFRAATNGRGMVALKKHPNGKSRSRVLIRCRMEAGTIGWAHVLPPFTRKNIPAEQLIGASRSSRIVTVHFRDRDPAMFETDKLTDALILEQGFVSLARLLSKHDA